MSRSEAPRAAVWALHAVSLLVPRARRADWLAEWTGEVDALARLRASGRAEDYPGWGAFMAGALPHAMTMRMEGWTMDGMAQDLKYAVRVLVRAPAFTLIAAVTLALGIGANGSIFSLVRGLLLRPPTGIVEPDRLIQIARSYEQDPRWDNWSWPALQTLRSESRALDDVAGYSDRPFVLGRGEDTEQVLGQLVTGNFFDVLGVGPRAGRLLRPDDDLEPGAHPVVVLSHALWTRRFGADPAVVGRTVAIGAQPYEIIGVAPAGFAGVEAVATPPALWIPTMQYPARDGRLPFDEWGWSWIQGVGRMRDGVTFAEAQTALGVVSSRLREASPVNEGILAVGAQGVGLAPADRRQASQISAILLMIVGVVLLLACTNVANLFLAKAGGRQSEMGVRMALGAGRMRVARQLLTECILIALLGTLLAVPVVMAAGRFLPLLLPYAIAVPLDPDASVYGVLILVGLSAGVLFGLAPAWATTKRGVVEALREGASTGGRHRTRLRDGLVVAQLGLSLGLVSGAALLGRSVLNARFAEPGFEPAALVAGVVDLAGTGRYQSEDDGRAAAARILRAAADAPGVSAATLASQLPIAGGHSRSTVRPVDREGIDFEAEYTVVGPSYFETMGIPIVRGRGLGGFDDEPEPVVVVNETLAGMFWPGEDPVGKQLTRGSSTWRVVGVAGDVQMRTLRERPRPGVYYPLAQAYSPLLAVTARGAGAGPSTTTLLRQAVASIDPELPVAQTFDLEGALAGSMGETRTIAWLIGTFAGLALVLAAVGLYGLVSFAATQRVRELGIRMALGAPRGSLTRLLLLKGLLISGAGIALGLAVSYGMGRALRGLLFGIAATDPATLVLASLVLLSTAALAAWIPARRASRVDAVVSLRES